MSPNRYRIPKELELVHAYHSDFMKILDFNTKVSLENLKSNPTTKVKLLIKQKGMCGMCGMTLLNESGEFEHDGTTNIHHKQARSKGGSKSGITNLMLTHTKCHIEHHRGHFTPSKELNDIIKMRRSLKGKERREIQVKALNNE